MTKLAFRRGKNVLTAPYFCSNELVFPWELFYPEDDGEIPEGRDPVSGRYFIFGDALSVVLRFCEKHI